MHLAMCTLRLFVLVGCILQSLDAAPANEKLPFEVDVNSGTDSGNVGFDKQEPVNSTGNKLTAQASKQGENFVASPKPPSAQGFSLDAEPETIFSSAKPAKKPPSSVSTPATNSATSTSATTAGGHWFLPNFLFGGGGGGGSSNPFSLDFAKMNPFGKDFHFGKTSPPSDAANSPLRKPSSLNSDFPIEKSSSLSDGLDFPLDDARFFDPSFAFGNYGGFQMLPIPPMPPMPPMPSLSDMKLVEDHILDDEHSKGRFRTYKSEDGNAMIQVMHRHGRVVSTPTTNADKPRSSRGRRRPLRHHPHFLRRHFSI